MSFFGLNLKFLKCHTPVPFSQAMVYEFRKKHFLSTDRVYSQLRISEIRQTIPRQLQNQTVILLKPIPLHSLCSAGLLRELAGYRSLPPRRSKQNLSYKNSRPGLSQHLSQCQSNPRLVHLRRFRPNPHRPSSQSLSQRGPWIRTESNLLCPRCHDHRFMSFFIPLGHLLKMKGNHQIVHAVRFAGQYSNPHHSPRQISRGQYPRRSSHRARIDLFYGQGLIGFCSPSEGSSIFGLFSNSGQKHFRFQKSLFTARRQIHEGSGQSNHRAQRIFCSEGLFRKNTTYSLLQFPKQQTVGVYNQQFCLASVDNCRSLSLPLASKVIYFSNN